MSSLHTALPPPFTDAPLTRLPTVLLHLVMQQLQIEGLARLASTCCLLRVNALHPSSGRYLRNSKGPPLYLRLSFEVAVNDDSDSPQSPAERRPLARAHLSAALAAERRMANTNQRIHSPLGRAHLSVTLAACPGVPLPYSTPPHASAVAALSALAAGWSHVETLDVADTQWWPVAGAVSLLSSPPLRRISSISNIDSVWLTASVQSAMCQLPHLTSIDIAQTRDFHPSLRLHPSALVHATALRHLSINFVNLPVHRLAGLIRVSALTSLQLAVDFWVNNCEPAVGLLAMLSQHCRPMLSGLRSLRLINCNLSNQPRCDIRRFFAAMPQLRFLGTHDCRPDVILRGLIDVGPDAMPELRVVRFCKEQLGYLGDESVLPVSLAQQFLSVFPSARYCYSIADEPDAEDRWTCDKDPRQWDRMCVKSDHAEPDSDGICFDCVELDPNRWNGLETMSVPRASQDSDEELAKRRAEHEPAPLTAEESLRQLQPAFEAALAAAGPRRSPERESELRVAESESRSS